MKKLLALALTLCMLLSLCSFAAAEADKKLTIWTWDPTFNIAAMKVAKEMYQQEHPEVEIDIQEVLSEDIETKVITAASAGDLSTLPDILLVQDNSFQKFATNYPEVYADLTDLYDYTDFAPAKVAYSTLNGRHFGIPFDAGTAIATYRTDYLAEAGYTIADLTDIDWDRFLEIGRDVKAKTGRPMLSGQAGALDTVLMMLQSCGSSMFTEEAQATVTKSRIRLLVLNDVQVKAQLIQSFFYLVIFCQVDQVVTHGTAHQELHGHIVNVFRILFLVLFLGHHPVINDGILHRIGHCLEDLLFVSLLNVLAVKFFYIILYFCNKSLLVKFLHDCLLFILGT